MTQNLKRVLIVDEWIETGAQVSAAVSLIERQGAIVAGIATINMDRNQVTEAIASKVRVWSAMTENSR